jgi:ubiquinone/menaquinone biosynthesis C-methylase UbiE
MNSTTLDRSASAQSPEALLGWMASLADPTRLRLLALLEQNELGVVDLCQVLQMPQSTVSRHLKVLLDEGWVSSRAQATARLYRMTPGELDPAARRLWLLAREQSETWPSVRQDRLRLERRRTDRRSNAQSFFAGAAGKWDELRAQLYGREFTQAALIALLPRSWVVADLGCGSGTVLAALAPHVRRVIGVDQSAAMLRAARRRTEALGSVELRRGSLEAVPVEDGSVDAALMILALTYVEDASRAVSEMARVLRSPGRAVVVDLLRHDREDFRRQMGQQGMGFEVEELAGLLERAGLEEVAARVLPPEPQAKGPALVLASGTRRKDAPTGKRGER